MGYRATIRITDYDKYYDCRLICADTLEELNDELNDELNKLINADTVSIKIIDSYGRLISETKYVGTR